MPAVVMDFGPLGVRDGSCLSCGGRLFLSRAGVWHPPALADKCPPPPPVEYGWLPYLQWRGQGNTPGEPPTWWWTPLPAEDPPPQTSTPPNPRRKRGTS